MSVTHSKWTDQQLRDLGEAFKLLDANSDGKVCAKEIAHIVNSMGLHVPMHKIQEILLPQGRIQLNFEEFVNLLGEKLLALNTDKQLRDTFHQLDTNCDGFISVKEVEAMLNKLGVRSARKHANQIIRNGDIDGDGKIDYQEFGRIMNGNDSYFF